MNSDDTSIGDVISFSDLAAALGEDEDLLLRRLAMILVRRERDQPETDCPEDDDSG
jgi:hypothetical protein